MIVVDSSVWIAYFNGASARETDLLDQQLGRARIIVGDLILAEVLQGFRVERDYQAAKNLLLEFEVRSMVDPRSAIRAAESYRKLRRRGITVRKTIDALIAVYCIEHKLRLLHLDRDFDAFESLGLKVLR